MKKIESLKIYGRRWFQRSYGNTYHTTTVIVNGEELKSNIVYGYGNHYLQTAADLLKENGYNIPENNSEAYILMTKYDHEVVDVKRKKDL
jgi:transcriptional regulator of met regulon